MIDFVKKLSITPPLQLHVFVGVANCGVSSVGEKQGRVVGGQEARPNEFPFIVSMKVKAKKNRCSVALFYNEGSALSEHFFRMKFHRLLKQH